MLLAARVGIKLLEVCLTIHKGYFMFDSSFVVKLALIKAAYTLKDGSAALILLVCATWGAQF